MKAFVGTAANNTHLHQVGQALEEAGGLFRFMVPFAGFPVHNPVVFARRRPIGIPTEKVAHRPTWEIIRVAAARARLPDTWIDRLWEHEEIEFARSCAGVIARNRPDVYLGVEHGALEALRASRKFGAAAGLIYTSLHHRFRERWLEPELRRFPQLLTESAGRIRSRDAARDARRDDEIRTADFFHANSLVTARSLEEAGVAPDRIITVPLGAPPALSDADLPQEPPGAPLVLFVGNVAVHKGAHHLLEAWARLGPRMDARLELYGSWALPKELHPYPSGSVVERGKVPHAAVLAAMREASVLVLPSVCDGFGMVAAEAMAQGLPVICSSNAGASQLVVEGKNGFVVPPANPEVLADRLAWCISHPKELHTMGRNAAETARNWTWADFRARFSSELEKMLEKLGRSPSPGPGVGQTL
jgi:glycosyltransferase involved in cell wall biosynthesis